MTISEALKTLRTLLGTSQQGFASKLNASIATVTRFEQGRTTPSNQWLATFADIALEYDAPELAWEFYSHLVLRGYGEGTWGEGGFGGREAKDPELWQANGLEGAVLLAQNLLRSTSAPYRERTQSVVDNFVEQMKSVLVPADSQKDQSI